MNNPEQKIRVELSRERAREILKTCRRALESAEADAAEMKSLIISLEAQLAGDVIAAHREEPS